MIKFEEHDGMLFEMLDKPVPLTKDAKMPCIIAPIQDDSPMGRYVKQCWGHDKLFMREYTICGINTDMAAKVGFAKDTPLSIHMFEIIGTFVKEGSDKWALYQMMRGNKVRHKFHILPNTHYAMNKKRQIAIFTTPSSMAYGGYVICHANDWLTSRRVDTIIDERTGWQIYKEPEHESQYKVGDWVEVHGCCQARVINIEYSSISGEAKYATLSSNNRIRISYITRKLDPSEVVIRIGCLSGTVEKSQFHKNGFILVTAAGNCWILFDALDKETRDLVEGLLKAQENDK